MPTLPSANPISSPYGWRTHPIHGGRAFHTGRDHAGYGPTGQMIVAPHRSRVDSYQNRGGYGRTMFLDDQAGTRHLFAHTNRALVPVGEWVEQGDPVAVIGTTGNSTGLHLHHEVFVQGHRIDPAAWYAAAAGSTGTIIPEHRQELDDMAYLIDDGKSQTLAVPGIGTTPLISPDHGAILERLIYKGERKFTTDEVKLIGNVFRLVR